MTRRTPSPVYVLSPLTVPDRDPLASGLKATKPMPSSSQVGITSFSQIRSIIEYSLWIARRKQGHGMRATDLLLGGLGLPPTEDLAMVDQLAHDSGDVFNDNGIRHPVLVVKVDMIGAEPSQGCVEVRADVLP